jgi:hypothetical protein
VAEISHLTTNARDRSIRVQWHGVNQFFATRNIRHSSKLVRAIRQSNFVILLWVGSMCLAVSRGWPADDLDVPDHALHLDSALVDRVGLAAPLSPSSRLALASRLLPPRAGAHRLCAMARVGSHGRPPWRRFSGGHPSPRGTRLTVDGADASPPSAIEASSAVGATKRSGGK